MASMSSVINPSDTGLASNVLVALRLSTASFTSMLSLNVNDRSVNIVCPGLEGGQPRQAVLPFPPWYIYHTINL